MVRHTSVARGWVLVSAVLCGCNGERAGEANVRVSVPGLRAQSSHVVAQDALAESWGLQQTLVASDGTKADRFGQALALSGDTLLVGAKDGAYVFVRVGGVWQEQQKLTAGDNCSHPPEYSDFVEPVALSGGTALIPCIKQTTGVGSVSVFVRSATTWSLQQVLTPADGSDGDGFGMGLALEGDTALVGASYDDARAKDAGAAYAFVRSGATWSQQAKLTGVGQQEQEHLGVAVALSGDTALVASYTAVNAAATGGVYAFVRAGASWSETKLLSQPTAGGLALLGDRALFATFAPFYDHTLHGQTQMLVRTGSDWSTVALSSPADLPNVPLHSGVQLAMADGLALLSSDNNDVYLAATLYAVSGDQLVRLHALYRDRVSPLGNVGVAISADAAFVGGPLLDQPGSVRVYTPYTEPNATCSADSDCASQHCVEGVCCDSACAGSCMSCLAEKKGYGRDGLCEGVALQTDTECAAAQCSGSEAQATVVQFRCDYAAGCRDALSKGCGAFVCVNGACLDKCSTPADCFFGFEGLRSLCVNGECVPVPLDGACVPTPGEGGASGASGAGGAGGAETEVGGAGATHQAGSGPVEAGPGADDAGGGAVDALPVSAARSRHDSSSCSVGEAGHPAPSVWLSLGGLALAVSLRRRRRAGA